jgi:hypothetical protein
LLGGCRLALNAVKANGPSFAGLGVLGFALLNTNL